MAAEPEADGETVLTDNKYLPILSGLGIITMFEDGSYHLEDTFTRAQFATVVMRIRANEEILSESFDKDLVKPCVESKVFGIGVEAFTSGSAEFSLTFAATHEGCLPLMDNGHYHPTEMVSDKIPALLCFFPEIALHITRPIRWDSDHVVLFDDETREMAKEIVRCDALDRVYMALDYFDASINRISAWTLGFIGLRPRTAHPPRRLQHLPPCLLPLGGAS